MTVLAEWILQGMALAMVVAGVLRLAPRTNAATRHLVWWTALLAVLVLPLARRSTTHASGGPLPEGIAASPDGLVPLALTAAPDWVGAIAVGAWLGLVLVGFTRLARGLARMRRLAASATPLPTAHQVRLPLWRSARTTGRPVALCVSEEVTGPCALGLGRPIILVPRYLTAALTDAALDQIVLHEYAHLARRDDWWRLVQVLTETLAGFHPAVWWIGRRIDAEREAACDDYVVAHTGAARHYAACLAEVAGLARLSGARGRSEPALVPGAMRRASVLRQRIGRLLDARYHGGLRPARLRLATALAALASAVAALSSCTPLLAFSEPAPAVAKPTPTRPAASSDRDERASAAGTSADAVASRPPAAHHVPVPPVPRNASQPPGLVDSGPAPTVSGATSSLRPASLTTLEPDALHALPTAEPLESRSIAGIVPPVLAQRPADPAGTADDRSPWLRVADGATALGMGTKKAGVAVGGFFARAGRGAAMAFQ